MRAIQPVHLRDTGAKVSNLHKGLLFLILHQSGVSEGDRITLQQQLAPDLRVDTFGRGTAHIVGLWQNQLKNWPEVSETLPNMPRTLRNKLRNLPLSPAGEGNGDVDELTAEALNWLLKQLGALSRR